MQQGVSTTLVIIQEFAILGGIAGLERSKLLTEPFFERNFWSSTKVMILEYLPIGAFAGGLQFGASELGLGESGRCEGEGRGGARQEGRRRRTGGSSEGKG